MENENVYDTRPNILSIWQDVRSECGYCKGRRAHVLTQKNPKQDDGPQPEQQDSQGKFCGNTVEVFQEDEISESTCSSSYACSFDSILPMSYQLLIERGFRRSGTLLYKPRNYSSCCPCIPIRLDVQRFQISKSQKKVLKVLSAALSGGDDRILRASPKNNPMMDYSCKEPQPQQTNKRQRNDKNHHMKSFQPSMALIQEKIQTCHLMSFLKDDLLSYLQNKCQYVKDINIDPKLCEWKVRQIYKLKRHDKDLITSKACVSSSILPALFHSTVKNVEHQTVVVQDLLATLNGDDRIWKYHHDELDSNGKIRHTIRVLPNVSLHEPSQQLNVHLQWTLYPEKVDSHPILHSPLHPSVQIKSTGQYTDINHDNEQQQQHQNWNKFNYIQNFLKSTGIKDLENMKPPYTLTIKMIPSHISGNMSSVHELYCKYQHVVHGDEDPFQSTLMDVGPEKVEEEEKEDVSGSEEYMLSFSDFEKRYPHFNHRKLTKVYKSYQAFYRFLCSSPILRGTPMPSIKSHLNVGHQSDLSILDSCISKPNTDPFHILPSDVNVPYGSYHQHYLINDKVLVAVGVVDVLPFCLSSVYSIYDPNLSEKLNLGKLTALYEIEWVKYASTLNPNLKYYYLGYYVHSCQKMKYKSEYKPSELNCPDQGVWVDFDLAIDRMNRRSPIRNCCNISSLDSKETKHMVSNAKDDDVVGCIRTIPFDIGSGRLLTLKNLNPQGVPIILPILEKFVEEVGSDVARMSVVKFF